MDVSETFEVLAVRYATRPGTRRAFFLGIDGSADADLPMDYFVWVARSATQTVVVDTGCTEEVATKRGRRYLAHPLELLADIGVAPGDVTHVVLTHFHNDHIGCLGEFPYASFLLQERELSFWRSPIAQRLAFKRSLEDADLAAVEQLSAAGRVAELDGDAEIVPGITAHLVGGHTPGMQVVRVLTTDGPLVLASDASHYYESITSDRPPMSLCSVPDVYAAFDRVRELALPEGSYLPGHDPLVMTRFSAPRENLVGRAIRIA